jgi:hypothetical protein
VRLAAPRDVASASVTSGTVRRTARLSSVLGMAPSRSPDAALPEHVDHQHLVTTDHPDRAEDAAMSISDVYTAPSRPARSYATSDLIDEVLACYREWRDSMDIADEYYAGWAAASGSERESWFTAYHVALDQEQAAAETYAVFATELRAVLRSR